MAAPALTPLPLFAQGLLKMITRHIANKAHAQITITIRDGKVQLVSETQTHLPDNLPG